MLLVIPCEPRVQKNARAIATSLVENTAPEDLLTVDLLCITPYQNLTAANDFIEVLKGRCNSFNVKCIDTPSASLYDMVNKMWAKCLQILAIEAAPNGLDIPVLWYSERGNQFFKQDAIATLDGYYIKRKAKVIFGQRFHIPARTITVDHVDPARDTVEGSFVFSSQISAAYPQTVPLSVSLQPADHFRVFLSGVFIGDQSEEYAKWDNLFSTEVEPKVEAAVVATQVLSQAVNTPQALPVAAFGASGASPDGQTLDVDGGMTLAQKRAMLAMCSTRSPLKPEDVTYSAPSVAGVTSDVDVQAQASGFHIQTSEGTVMGNPGAIEEHNKRVVGKKKKKSAPEPGASELGTLSETLEVDKEPKEGDIEPASGVEFPEDGKDPDFV